MEFLGSSGWASENICLYMPIKDGDLTHLVKEDPEICSNESTLGQLLREMLAALEYLAFNGYCHRDVKPANILYTAIGKSYTFQLGDFGLACHPNDAKSKCGSNHFMAPEVSNSSHRQSPKLDVWSLFVTIASVTSAAKFNPYKYSDHDGVHAGVRLAAERLWQLEPMAREDQDLRASAAQMLVKLYNANGLTTPRNQISTIDTADVKMKMH